MTFREFLILVLIASLLTGGIGVLRYLIHQPVSTYFHQVHTSHVVEGVRCQAWPLKVTGGVHVSFLLCPDGRYGYLPQGSGARPRLFPEDENGRHPEND